MPKEDALGDFLAGHEPMPSGASLSPGAAVSDWRIVAFLGKGGNAEVYRATHESSHQVAAIKILFRRDGSRLERFRREIDMLSGLKCQALPRFFDAGEVDGRPYIAMELLEPCELPNGDREVASFLIAVAESVKSLHNCGIVHRDLKPQNIMRRRDSSLAIIDLGLAKRISESCRLPQLDTLSIVDGRHVGLGTPQYAAPEQFSGGEITPSADIHALGKLADDCFGGNPPRAWRRIIERATSSIPERRYPSVAAFKAAVRARFRTARLLSALAVVAISAVALLAAWRCIELRRVRMMEERRFKEEMLQKEHEEIMEMLQRDVY